MVGKGEIGHPKNVRFQLFTVLQDVRTKTTVQIDQEKKQV